MSHRYVALIADAVASRTLSPSRRARLQADLRAALPELNAYWRQDIAAGFALTRGDEIEVLLHGPKSCWDIAHHLRRAFGDVHWVIACGLGEVTTPLAPVAAEVDGPCFHAARAALDDAKTRRLLFAFRGFERDDHLNGFAAYYSALYWSWTSHQRRESNNFRSATPAPPVREKAKVIPSAISHLRRRLAWPLVAAGDKMFRALLEEAR